MTRPGRLKVRQPANQSVNGGSKPTPGLHFWIKPVCHQVAKDWIEAWHYSKLMPTGKNISFGLFEGDVLYAVIVYGIGVNPYQAKFLKVKRVLEIKRMARSEPKKEYPLSRLIAISSRLAKIIYPFDALVAFADPEYDHQGTVYAAAGFKFEGKTAAESHVVGLDGVQHHRRVAYRYARRRGITIAKAREILHFTIRKTLPKFRWVKR